MEVPAFCLLSALIINEDSLSAKEASCKQDHREALELSYMEGHSKRRKRGQAGRGSAQSSCDCMVPGFSVRFFRSPVLKDWN